MTARERAEALVPAEWSGTTEERIEQIAAAIRSAEAAAYERAATACRSITPAKDRDGWLAREGWELARGECEDAVRALATKETP